ncbi:MAG: hypothetical protein ACKOXF_04580 [Chitinophagaceae bacterium]
MKFQYLFAFLFLILFNNARAQQNFFNVPSSDITETKKIFFQQQFNFFSGSISSNSTFSYGIGHHAEIGLNLLGVTYDNHQGKLISSSPNEQPVFPSLGCNAQKQLLESKSDELTIGGQLLFPSIVSKSEYYTYLNNKLQLHHLKMVTGIYFGNNNFFDDKSRFNNNIRKFGIQIGMEYQIIEDKLFFQTDFISGKTAMSNLIIGGAYKCSKHAIISTGYQFPNDKNHYSKGFILEFTFI